MNKGIEDLLNEYSSDDDSQSSIVLRNSTVDLLLESDEDDGDDGGSGLLAHEIGATVKKKYDIDINKDTKKLSDRDLVEKLIASNDSDSDQDGGSANDNGLSSSIVNPAKGYPNDVHSIKEF